MKILVEVDVRFKGCTAACALSELADVINEASVQQLENGLNLSGELINVKFEIEK